MAGSSKSIWLAWNGWHMRVPEDWRPLRVYGTGVRGHMTVGDSATAVFQIKWWRRKQRRFNAARWMADRARVMRGEIAELRGARPQGFSETAWLPAARGKSGRKRPIWYGYAPGPQLVVEVVVNPILDQRVLERLAPRVLASLGASGAGKPIRWSVFGASFETPPDLVLRRQRMHLGDITLDLSQGGRRLIVRQIYPAEIALSRRTMEKWLTIREFKERRIFRPSGDPVRWETRVMGERLLNGLLQEGRSTIAWPLGFIRPRNCVRGIVCDEEIDRLLIARTEVVGGPGDRESVERALAGMNWAMREA